MIRRDDLNSIFDDWNMDDTTRERRISMLCQIIKNESEKPIEDRDIDLIFECSEYLNELSESELPITNEKLESGLKEIKSSTAMTVTKENQTPLESDLFSKEDKRQIPNGVSNRSKKKKHLKVLFVATTLSLLIIGFVTLTVVAQTNGYNSIWDYLMDNSFKMKPGESTVVNGITIVKANGSVSYSSVEEWIRMENQDLLYPSALPSNAQIQKIIEIDEGDGKIRYVFKISKADITAEICNYVSNLTEQWEEYTEYQSSELKFVIQKWNEEKYIAVCTYNGYEYSISATNYNDMIYILDHMKGILK